MIVRLCIIILMCATSSVFTRCPTNSISFYRNKKLICAELSMVNITNIKIKYEEILFQRNLSWFKAKRRCIKDGKKLLEIHNSQEAAEIEEKLPKLKLQNSDIWIGGENHAYVRCYK